MFTFMGRLGQLVISVISLLLFFKREKEMTIIKVTKLPLVV